MTIFIIGVVLAVAVATTYVTVAVRDFLRIRREVNRAAGSVAAESSHDASLDAGRETVGFAWRASGGVVCSVALLELISHAWWAWYLFPALALGTGVAVSIAFVIDPTKTE
jgi:hypothetical protein